MSLFNSQTIFSLLITLLVGVALYYYIRYKTRVLELTVREQAKVLQSVIMSMNSNNQNIMNMVQNRSQEEVVSDAVTQDMNRFREVNSNNELIEVSDDSDSGSESGSDGDSDSESDSGSDTSSEGGSDTSSEGGSEHYDEPNESQEEDVANNGTRKIVFNGGNDCHVVEHLDGPDVKVIELTHPLYPKNENEVMNGHEDDDEDDEADDDEDDVDEDEDSDSESLPSDMDIQHDTHENHEIKENVVTNEVNNQNHLEIETISEVIPEDNSLNNLSVKTVFKTKDNKDSDTYSDYNSMNVQSLRQLLKSKLSTEGTHMSEASINKLTKKDLIKHLS
jgi:hypothetical protein